MGILTSCFVFDKTNHRKKICGHLFHIVHLSNVFRPPFSGFFNTASHRRLGVVKVLVGITLPGWCCPYNELDARIPK